MKTVGSDYPGGFVTVRPFENQGRHTVMLVCDGGNVRYQQNMTPTEARTLAGYLQAFANECEQAGKTEILYIEDSGV